MTLQMRQSFFIPTGSEILLLTYQQRRTPESPQVYLYKLKDPYLFIEEESFLLTHPSTELPFWRRRGLPKQCSHLLMLEWTRDWSPALFLVRGHSLGHCPSLQVLITIETPVSTKCTSPASTYPWVLDSNTNCFPVSILGVKFTAEKHHIPNRIVAFYCPGALSFTQTCSFKILPFPGK